MLVLAYYLDLCQTEALAYRANWHKNSLRCRVSSVLTKLEMGGKDDCVHHFPISLIHFDRQAADARRAVPRT